MGCTRNRSKIWGERAVLAVLWVLIIRPDDLWAAFASQFSLSVGEEYTDNLFFSKKKEHDFVTVITPTLSLYYAPIGQTEPTLNLNISPSGQIYARHGELTTFGFTDNSSINGGYTVQYSPRLSFNFSETFQRQGDTRLTGLIGSGSQLPLTPTAPFPQGGSIPNTASQNLKDYTSGGQQLSNSFALQGIYRYRPDLSVSGGYSNSYAKFITQGGSDLSQTFSIRGVYNWKQEHNLHVGYSLSIVNPRNGDDGVIHDFDFGDDYFSSHVYKIQITPTLSLAASTGLSINTSGSGPTVANNTAITVTKLWETANLSGGIRKGLTPSFGISGVSDTTNLFANFTIQLAERLTGTVSSDFSYFDTDDVNFKTLRASAGINYLINSWLSSSLAFSYRASYGGAGASNTDLLARGKVSASNVFLSFTARFDIWPNTGLARSAPFTGGAPVLRTPFPVAPASSPTPSSQPATSGSSTN
jgi:hypothetical protein